MSTEKKKLCSMHLRIHWTTEAGEHHNIWFEHFEGRSVRSEWTENALQCPALQNVEAIRTGVLSNGQTIVCLISKRNDISKRDKSKETL